MTKRHHPLPLAEEVDAALSTSIARHLGRHDVSPERLRFDIRHYGQADGRIHRIGIGFDIAGDVHRDACARPGYQMVEPGKTPDWRTVADCHVETITAQIARLDARRAAFGDARVPPRLAWDIHPAAASILASYRRIPDLDGSHRLDGEFGRMVELGEGPGIKSTTFAYGDGVIQLVTARFAGGASMATREGRLVIRIPEALPDVIASALVGRPAGAVSSLLARGPLAPLATITRVRQTMDGVEITLRDVLVPWDGRCKGVEAWRTTRMRMKKQSGSR